MDAQKKSLGASERNEEERSAWRDEVKDIEDPARFVFVDECGTNITLTDEALREGSQRGAGLR